MRVQSPQYLTPQEVNKAIQYYNDKYNISISLMKHGGELLDIFMLECNPNIQKKVYKLLQTRAIDHEEYRQALIFASNVPGEYETWIYCKENNKECIFSWCYSALYNDKDIAFYRATEALRMPLIDSDHYAAHALSLACSALRKNDKKEYFIPNFLQFLSDNCKKTTKSSKSNTNVYEFIKLPNALLKGVEIPQILQQLQLPNDTTPINFKNESLSDFRKRYEQEFEQGYRSCAYGADDKFPSYLKQKTLRLIKRFRDGEIPDDNMHNR
jgi:hypothetical protein